MAATASDLLAKMGRPLGFTLGLFLPEDLEEGFVLELVRGAAEAAKRLGAFLLGGDTNRGWRWPSPSPATPWRRPPAPEGPPRGPPLPRRGPVGEDGGGHKGPLRGALLGGLSQDPGGRLLPPAPPGLLALSGLLRGSLDSSDGLAETLWQLADLGVGVEVEALPSTPTSWLSRGARRRPWSSSSTGARSLRRSWWCPRKGRPRWKRGPRPRGFPLPGREGGGGGRGLPPGAPLPRKGYAHF